MPYDMPMNMTDLLSDEERRRAALGYLGAPDAPATETATLPQQPTPLPAAGAFDDLAKRFLEAQQADREDAASYNLGAHLSNYARSANDAAGVPQPGGHMPLRQMPGRAQSIEDAAKVQALGLKGGASKPEKSTDPSSPASRRAQILVKATLSDKFSDDEIAQLTEADAENALKYGSLSSQREVTREGHVDAMTRSRLDRSQRAELFAKQYDLDWAKLSQDQKQFLETLADKEKDRAAKKEEQVAGATERFGDAVDKTGAPKFYAQYDEAAQIIGKYPRDLPGIGRIDGRKPDEAISTDGRQLRFLVGQMLSEYRKGQTGAGMSDTERAEYGQITGLLQSGNDGAIRQGLDTLKRALDARVSGVAAGFRPEAVELYGARAPRVRAVVQPNTPRRAPATSALPADSSGQPTLDTSPTIRPMPKLEKGQLLRDVAKEGDVFRVPMGGGKYRVMVKRNGRMVDYKE